jgi:plasmid stabilization system protein ParE
MPRLVFSPAFLSKLEAICGYIADTLMSPDSAAARAAQILDGLNILKANPDIGPRLSSRIEKVPSRFSETRFLICGDYIVIYDHADDTVKILALYHGNEDVFGRFFKEIL